MEGHEPAEGLYTLPEGGSTENVYTKKILQELLQRIEEEIAEVAVVRPAAITISADEIKRSVTESLATI